MSKITKLVCEEGDEDVVITFNGFYKDDKVFSVTYPFDDVELSKFKRFVQKVFSGERANVSMTEDNNNTLLYDPETNEFTLKFEGNFIKVRSKKMQKILSNALKSIDLTH